MGGIEPATGSAWDICTAEHADYGHLTEVSVFRAKAAGSQQGRFQRECRLYEYLNLTSLLILTAVGAYVLAFLFRSQIYIRLLVVLGSVCYCAYYLTVGSEPLWDAFLGTALIALASFQGMVRLWLSRIPAILNSADRPVWRLMGDIEPGLFRQLSRAGKRIEIETTTILTQEGAAPDALWFLIEGELRLERRRQPSARLQGSGFVGEIAWLNRGSASATVIAEPGTKLIRWHVPTLRRTLRKNHRLELALEALIAHDMARKLANSSPIQIVADDGQATIPKAVT